MIGGNRVAGWNARSALRLACAVIVAVVPACPAAEPAVDGGERSDAPVTTGDAPIVGDDAGTADGGAVDPDAPAPSGDGDLDGLDDAEELRIATEYLPYLSVDPTDGCPRSAILFRVRPHPDGAARLAVTMVVLYENDCGASGHVGDDEVFGMTIDPAVPAPEGILAIRTIAHQNTACEAIHECGTCAGFTPCTTGLRRGALYPIVFASKNKHGWYATEADCDNACFFTNQCVVAPSPAEPPMLNAGEPGAPLTRNLTTSGLITAEAGWTEAELFDFDPWASLSFGGAGDTTSDLMDAAFLTPACL